MQIMIRKLKDLIYDYNDIFVALLIVALAGFIIFWRVTDIMAYPSYLASKDTTPTSDVDFSGIDLSQQEVEEFNENPEDFNSGETDPGVDPGSDASGDNQENANQQLGEQTPEGDFKITIPSGSSGEKIAQILLDNHVITSKENFLATVEEKGVASKLKAGTFTIPAGSSMNEIVNIITK